MRTHRPGHVGTPTLDPRTRAPSRRRGSALLECLIALVLLEITGLLLVSAARTVAWSGRLDRFTTMASAMVMVAADSVAPQGCMHLLASRGIGPAGPVTGRALEPREDPGNGTTMAEGGIALPVPPVPPGTGAAPSVDAMVYLPWHAAWWCMP